MTATVTGLLICASVAALAGNSAAQPLPARDHHYGVMVDAGLPDGVNTSFVYRPTPQLRVHVGGGYNLISKGLRAGATMLTNPGTFSGSLSLEAGHYFPGDANALADALTGEAGTSLGVLKSVGYNYGNAHVGIEMGIRRFTFYVHVGASFMMTHARNLNDLFAADSPNPSPEPQPMVEIRDDPSLLIFTVSARFGAVVYF